MTARCQFKHQIYLCVFVQHRKLERITHLSHTLLYLCESIFFLLISYTTITYAYDYYMKRVYLNFVWTAND